MKAVNILISKIINNVPELATTRDLIKTGLYRSEQAAYMARRQRRSPPWMRLPGLGIVYPRDGIIEFLEKQFATTGNWNASNSHSDGQPVNQKNKVMPR
jgi:hypothetical protein